MNPDLRNNLWRIGGRFLIALPFFGIGSYQLFHAIGTGSPGMAYGTVLFGIAFIIVGSCIVAFPLAELFARPLMSLYWPTGSGPAQPNFSIPEAHVKQGRYEQAMIEYEAIAQQKPDELRAYLGMVEVAFRDLKDPERAAAVYRQGMDHLGNEKTEAVLHRMYTAYRSLSENPPH
jgi:hypothetical protein